MRALLIGASGCFGTEFLNITKKISEKIVVKHYPSKKLNILKFRDLKKKINKLKPNVIINSSAIVGINQCETSYEKAFSVNCIGALNLAKICKLKKIILVQTSTHAVFDGVNNSFYNEKSEPKPNNVYSGTKYLSEIFVKSICKRHYIIRFPTLFGMRKNKLLGFVDKVILSLKSNKTLKIAKDRIDTPTYAKDAAKQLIQILIKRKPYGTYHLTNSGKVSYLDFVKYIKLLVNSKSKIIPVKDSFFLSKGYKPLKTSLKSTKLNSMRNWKLAMKEYIASIK